MVKSCNFCAVHRSRLATLDVDLPPHIAAKRGSVSSNYGMIALLCALFLSKQGAGEAAEAIEEKTTSEVSFFTCVIYLCSNRITLYPVLVVSIYQSLIGVSFGRSSILRSGYF